MSHLASRLKSMLFAVGAALSFNVQHGENIKAPSITYEFTCRDSQGKVKWVERTKNLVTTQGKNLIVDTLLQASAYTGTWYMGLKGSGSISASDTMASHAGWSELAAGTAYTATSSHRPLIAWGTTTAGSNTAAGVAFAMIATNTVAGAFITQAQTGTAGSLYSVADFSVARGVASGDTVTVTATISVS